MLESIFARIKGRQEKTSKDVNAFKESKEEKKVL
jgi:hypothetical protein